MKKSFSHIANGSSRIWQLLLLLLVQQPHSSSAQWALHSYLGGGVLTSMAYDTNRNEILAAGTAYANELGIFPGGGPRCLIATIETGRLGRFRRNRFRVSHRRAIQKPQVCTSTVVLDDPGDAILLGYHPVTTSSADGEVGVVTAVKEMMVTVDYFGETLTPDSVITIEDKTAISYPIATTHDGGVGIFTAIHQTDQLPPGMVQSATDPLAFILALKDEATLPTDNYAWKPRVQRLHGLTGDLEWSVDITMPGDRQVMLSSLAYDKVEQVLYVAGSKSVDDSDDWTGFVMKLDAASGSLVGNSVASNAKESVEIKSQQGKNDYVHCICLNDKANVIDDSGAIYIIGTTEGKMDDESPADGGAFIRKVDKSTFETLWTQQLSLSGLEGSVCAAHENAVYMGGQVPAAKIGPDQGKNNVYLTQFSTVNGDELWTKELGTESFHEYLVELLVDQDGAPIIAGNSDDRDNGSNNFFFIMFDKVDGTNNPQWTRPVAAQSVLDKNDNDDKKEVIIALSISIPVLLALLTICICCHRRRAAKEPEVLAPDHDLALEPSVEVGTKGETEKDDDVSVISTTEPKLV